MRLTEIIETVNKFLWDGFLLIVLFGSGIFFTFKLNFVQIRKFSSALRKTFSGINFKEKAGKDGMSSFQALATSIAAQIGTGSLAGAAVAICMGGPGAVFWMWISSFSEWLQSISKRFWRRNTKQKSTTKSAEEAHII